MSRTPRTIHSCSGPDSFAFLATISREQEGEGLEGLEKVQGNSRRLDRGRLQVVASEMMWLPVETLAAGGVNPPSQL